MRNHSRFQTPLALITTSWDDGHPLDIRLAELLARYGLKGTFYVPLKYNGQSLLDRSQLVDLNQLGMEIGSHTLTHPLLTKINRDRAFIELRDSKKTLEDILGKSVSSFCYPGGKFNYQVRSLVIRAGYSLARTTVGFRTEMRFDPFCMPVSTQIFPHKKSTYLKHALKEGNIRGVMHWALQWRFENGVDHLVRSMFDHVAQHGGILHIWGHSWEIDSLNLWNKLEEMFAYIANRSNLLYLTNSQLLEFSHS